MSLRAKILVYLVLLHAVLAALSIPVLIERPGLLLAFEALFAVSLVVGILLLRAFFVPLRLIRTGADLMHERDFTTRFREVGQPEMDALVRVYNRMVDRLREERRAAEERDLFVAKVLDASPTAIAVLDHDGRAVEVNRAFADFCGATAEGALLGRPPAAWADGAAGPVAAELGPALAALGPDASVVATVAGRRVRCRRADFYDRGARRDFFLVDELTRELRETEKAAYGQVIRMMSHEVNNSVGSVRSLLESCSAYAPQLAEEDRADYAGALDVASGRLRSLSEFMSGLASVVRVPEPERRPCDVPALLADLERLLAPELARRRIRVRRDLAALGGPVELDKNQFEQVLVNLMRNAMEAIEEDGALDWVAGRGADGRRWLALRDSGPGIPPEAREAIFRPFFSTKRDGRGVGLTLTREVLARHGFGCSLTNRPEGGAEFRIDFDPPA